MNACQYAGHSGLVVASLKDQSQQ